MSPHVLVNPLLQIDSKRTITPNDDVRAHPRIRRDIPSGIVENDIGGIIPNHLGRPVKRSIDKTLMQTWPFLVLREKEICADPQSENHEEKVFHLP